MKRAYYNPLYNEDSELSFSSCGYEIQGSDFINHLNLKRRYILEYIINGSGYYEVRGKKIHLKRGDVFVVYPQEPITYYCSDTTWEVCWFCFSGTQCSKLLEDANISKETLLIKNVNPRFVKVVTDCLEYAENTADNCSEFMLLSYLFSGLATVEGLPANEISKSERHVTSAISFMEYNYGSGINISDVCKQLQLDRTYFYRIFKSETGTSPSRFLMEMRISKAKQLMRENMDLKNVAYSVGLKDVYYFSTLFKQVEGISPGQYKKRLAERNINL